MCTNDTVYSVVSIWNNKKSKITNCCLRKYHYMLTILKATHVSCCLSIKAIWYKISSNQLTKWKIITKLQSEIKIHTEMRLTMPRLYHQNGTVQLLKHPTRCSSPLRTLQNRTQWCHWVWYRWSSGFYPMRSIKRHSDAVLLYPTPLSDVSLPIMNTGLLLVVVLSSKVLMERQWSICNKRKINEATGIQFS